MPACYQPQKRRPIKRFADKNHNTSFWHYLMINCWAYQMATGLWIVAKAKARANILLATSMASQTLSTRQNGRRQEWDATPIVLAACGPDTIDSRVELIRIKKTPW